MQVGFGSEQNEEKTKGSGPDIWQVHGGDSQRLPVPKGSGVDKPPLRTPGSVL